jgi:hypothetical protein
MAGLVVGGIETGWERTVRAISLSTLSVFGKKRHHRLQGFQVGGWDQVIGHPNRASPANNSDVMFQWNESSRTGTARARGFWCHGQRGPAHTVPLARIIA